ncbi:YbaN family protein [candidate division KSB1 bacterium]
MIKILYIILGTISLLIGIIGIFIPGLPTTPFLLLTAGLYIRSSGKLYNKLINNRYLGHYILSYRENKGLEKKVKIFALLFSWIMILISAFFLTSDLVIRLIILHAGLIGTIVILMIPTIKK